MRQILGIILCVPAMKAFVHDEPILTRTRERCPPGGDRDEYNTCIHSCVLGFY